MKELLSIIANKKQLEGSELIKKLLENLDKASAYEQLEALVPELENFEKEMQRQEERRQEKMKQEHMVEAEKRRKHLLWQMRKGRFDVPYYSDDDFKPNA